VKLSWKRWALLLVAIGLILSSWWGIAIARSGLEIRSLQREGIPLLYVAPQGARSVPGVLVAHGFAGSKQLMLGYAHVLARAGYAVLLWDFDGHGANPARLRWDEGLGKNLDIARQVLLEQPEVDRSRLALLGHSMGSGIAMDVAIGDPESYAATIAVSPTGAGVTSRVPRNLQLQAGSGEGFFVDNARKLLARAGGENDDLAGGKGRELVVVPNVEHITILFSDGSHRAALRWMDETFGKTSESRYLDRRLGWYSVHLLGWLVVIAAVAPLLTEPENAVVKISRVRGWVGLGIAPVVGVAGLVVLGQRIDLSNLGGVQVGGAVGIWFFLAGLTWLGIIGRVFRPTFRSLVSGLALFGLLWIAFGAMAQVVWLQWWLIPTRFGLWLPLAIACFPWFLATGIAQRNTGAGERVLWWLGQSVVLVGGFAITIYFLPRLSFMFLLLPLFPPLFGIFSLVAGLLNQAWVYAIGAALFFGWLLTANFPLSA
jgi:pimeloyl-ACP methyl ester carboxylesterase